jgi:Spy/CpxP family protein refolding chaperone
VKTWIKRTLIGLLGASVVVGGIAACGHRAHGPGWQTVSAEDAAKWRERLIDRAGRELELNDAQKQQLGVVFDRLREQRNAFVGSGGDPRAELRGLIAGERFDVARAQAIVDEKARAVTGRSPQTIEAIAAFYDGLNAEQQRKLRDWLDKHQRRFGRG